MSDLVRVGLVVLTAKGKIVAEFLRGSWYEPREVHGQIEYECASLTNAAKYEALPDSKRKGPVK